MERAIPILPTNDLTAAKAFYVDGLGFHVTWEHTSDNQGLLGLARGTIVLTLDRPMTGHGREAFVGLDVAGTRCSRSPEVRFRLGKYSPAARDTPLQSFRFRRARAWEPSPCATPSPPYLRSFPLSCPDGSFAGI